MDELVSKTRYSEMRVEKCFVWDNLYHYVIRTRRWDLDSLRMSILSQDCPLSVIFYVLVAIVEHDYRRDLVLTCVLALISIVLVAYRSGFLSCPRPTPSL